MIPLLSGCCKPVGPEDLPQLYPCMITVLQDDKPLAEGIVTLVSTDPSFKWSVFAQLNSSGVGKVFTQGLYPGAPEGEYKVVISKEESVPEEVASKTVVTVYTLVGKEYTDAKTTPLALTISNKGNDRKFDCGQAVHEFLNKVEP